MELNLQEIKKDLKIFIDENGECTDNNDNEKISVGKTSNGVYFIHYEFKDTDEFKEYLDSLSDELFIEALKKFRDYNGDESVKELQTNINSKRSESLKESFKQCVQEIVSEKIESLKKFL